MGYILTTLLVFCLLIVHVFALIFAGKNEQLLEERIPIVFAILCGVIVLVIGCLPIFRRQFANLAFTNPRTPSPPLLEKQALPTVVNILPSETRNAVATISTERPVAGTEIGIYDNQRPSPSEDRSQAEKVVATLNKSGLRSWSFSLPKEGYNLERCADKFNQHYSSNIYRVAVADGVSASFLPASWAQIVATEYVKEGFHSASEFVNWLSNCSALWNRWVKEEWIPRADEAAKIQRGLEYWKHEIEDGSETTLVGCSFSPQDLLTKDEIIVHVDVVGDAEFFLVRQPGEPQGRWRHQSFALTHPGQFGVTPDTLPTSGQYMQDTWQYVKTRDYLVQRGDYLLLTTDALAEWILTSVEQQQNPWVELLALKDEQEFRVFVEEKRSRGEMHVDDTTLLVVHLETSPLRVQG